MVFNFVRVGVQEVFFIHKQNGGIDDEEMDIIFGNEFRCDVFCCGYEL